MPWKSAGRITGSDEDVAASKLDGEDRAAADMRQKRATDGLDFGKFGHAETITREPLARGSCVAKSKENHTADARLAGQATCRTRIAVSTMSLAVRLHILSISAGVFADLGMRLTYICSSVKPSPDWVRASAMAEPRPPP